MACLLLGPHDTLLCVLICAGGSEYIKIYVLVAVCIYHSHCESVQYVIYVHWLSFDLRCESGTYM